VGFNKAANTDVAGTLQAAVDKINGLSVAPQFILHTGDISHLSKPEEFDTVDQILKGAKPKDIFYVPSEHDVLNDDDKQFLKRYGKGSNGAPWYSFDKKGVHFVGLVNVMNLKAGGLGSLGHGTEDSARALGYLEKFGSVTVLNGHTHQTMQKIEGKK
jgi:3',5'-cyclic-AMP phosphodiesterase